LFSSLILRSCRVHGRERPVWSCGVVDWFGRPLISPNPSPGHRQVTLSLRRHRTCAPNNCFHVRLRFILRSAKNVAVLFCIPSYPHNSSHPNLNFPPTINFPPNLNKICSRTWVRGTNKPIVSTCFSSHLPNNGKIRFFLRRNTFFSQKLPLRCGSPNASPEVVHRPRSESPLHFDIRNM